MALERQIKHWQTGKPVVHGYDYSDFPIIRPTMDRSHIEVVEADCAN